MFFFTFTTYKALKHIEIKRKFIKIIQRGYSFFALKKNRVSCVFLTYLWLISDNFACETQWVNYNLSHVGHEIIKKEIVAEVAYPVTYSWVKIYYSSAQVSNT
eukprot:snap_masked-scaffold_17-processed-gene-1.28-mRNA-1 protein AED:1.00 eAED:1.00 QI:0/0/0/0/1/1/2/0/102